VFFEESAIVSADRDADLIAFNDALNALEKRDARKVRVVEMRFFGGLSVKEIAEALKVSTQTVWRGWSLSKAWLAREMSERPNG